MAHVYTKQDGTRFRTPEDRTLEAVGEGMEPRLMATEIVHAGVFTENQAHAWRDNGGAGLYVCVDWTQSGKPVKSLALGPKAYQAYFRKGTHLTREIVTWVWKKGEGMILRAYREHYRLVKAEAEAEKPAKRGKGKAKDAAPMDERDAKIAALTDALAALQAQIASLAKQ